MCGRFTQKFTWHEIRDLYELVGAARNLQTHYNIAPTDKVEVVRPTAEGTAELVPMRWGFVPYWWKKPLKEMPATFNARAETVADKPMFRGAFKRHRCVVPANGYYEWLKRPDGKQPYFISAADDGVLSLAGLWDRWKDPEIGDLVNSCTIIVTNANKLISMADSKLTQEWARAWVDAGVMPLPDYLDLCRENDGPISALSSAELLPGNSSDRFPLVAWRRLAAGDPERTAGRTSCRG